MGLTDHVPQSADANARAWIEPQEHQLCSSGLTGGWWVFSCNSSTWTFSIDS